MGKHVNVKRNGTNEWKLIVKPHVPQDVLVQAWYLMAKQYGTLQSDPLLDRRETIITATRLGHAIENALQQKASGQPFKP